MISAQYVDGLELRIRELEAFKAYVHQRLDAMGVLHSIPESEHDKAGCQVGGRLDWAEKQLAAEREVSDKLEKALYRLLSSLDAEGAYREELIDIATSGANNALAEVAALRKGQSK